MANHQKLRPGHYYHIYNRGNNRENLFREPRNYHFFLLRYLEHVSPFADTLAYCLLINHFHFIVKIRCHVDGLHPPLEVNPKSASRAFANFFISYARSFNNLYDRTGALFQRPFGRREIKSPEALRKALLYVHANPMKHGFTEDFASFKWSSYRTLDNYWSTFLDRDSVMDLMGGRDQFRLFHKEAGNPALSALLRC